MAKKYTDEELNRIDKELRNLIEDQDRTYLIVDPSTPFRKLVVNTLKTAGCENIIEAKDGSQGLMRATKVEGSLVVIVETKMPVMDGPNFFVKLRKETQHKTAPVIFVSSECRKSFVVALIKAGASAYMVKPFEGKVLIDKMKSLELI